MDLKTSNYHLHHSPLEEVKVKKDNPFDDTFPDHLSKLIPMAKSNVNVNVNVVEAPPTPGRPVFSFSVGSRKNFPSKWDDAQKWLISSPDSPASHAFLKSHVKPQQQLQHHHHKTELVVTDEKKDISVINVPTQDHHSYHGDSSDVLLKDKFTNEEEQNYSRFKCLVPMKQGFEFSSMKDASTEVVHEIKRCPTPYKNTSPPRHNTPASMSGPLALMNGGSPFDITELQECHLAKMQLENTSFDSVTCNWSSREEEEEDVSKSLRHFEINNECPKTIIPDTKPCFWEQEENTKSNLRYQREEAKIQAWVNLQKAKAEAQSRKLEVKIQKMTSKFEEKMMKKMEIVHRKAEELRAAARYEHNMQLRKVTMRTKKTKDLHEDIHFSGSCGCIPCNNTFHP